MNDDNVWKKRFHLFALVRLAGVALFLFGIAVAWPATGLFLAGWSLLLDYLFLPLVIYLQSVLGMTALRAGLTTAPLAMVSMFVAPVAGRVHREQATSGARRLASRGASRERRTVNRRRCFVRARRRDSRAAAETTCDRSGSSPIPP